MSMPASARVAMERLIVRSLIRHMATKGFTPFRVNDGEFTYPKTEDEALDAVFAVDESSLRFVPTADFNSMPTDRKFAAERVARVEWRRRCENVEHGVLLICGNGTDIISDWNYTEGDPDGFSAAMDAFPDTEELVAHLTEAAPLMLAALEGLFEHCAMVHTRWGEGSNAQQADAAINAARAALAYAKRTQIPETSSRPEEDQPHAGDCAKRFHAMAECTCGKAEAEAEGRCPHGMFKSGAGACPQCGGGAQ